MTKQNSTQRELQAQLDEARERIRTLEKACEKLKADEPASSVKSEDYLRSLLRSIPDLIWLKDTDGVFLSCNTAVERLFGAREEEIVGKTDYDFVPKDLADFFRVNDRKTMETGRPSINEECLTFSDGYRGVFETIKTPMYDRNGDLIGVLGIARDITDRKRTEEALERRMVALTQPMDDVGSLTFADLFNLDDIQRLQDEFAQATGVASLILTPDGVPITRPSNFCHLCEIIRSTEKGRQNCRHSDAIIGQLSPGGPTIQPCLSGGLWDAGAGISVGGRHVASWLVGQVRDETQSVERLREYAREIGADEDEVDEAFRNVPAMSREQFAKVAKTLYTLADQISSIAYQNVQQARFIFERRQAEAELVEMRDRAEEASRVKSEFLANMSHEIRTPLNGVLGMLQLMELTELSEEQKEYVDTATESTRRLTRLLADILDISRIEAGKMRIEPSEFRIGNLKKSILGLFSQTAEERQNKLDFILGEDVPELLVGDEARLRQILFNLVGNAVKFTENGSVSVRIDRLPFDRTGRVMLLFTVSDTGIGISEDQIKEIFDPFVQGERSFTRRFQGVGLGLSIVRKLVELMDGSLSLDSREGEGSTIVVSLPFGVPREKQDEPDRIRPGQAPTPISGLRILLVEDDQINRESGRLMLERAGHTVALAENGKEAVASVTENDFDLVLMDIQMPEMGGVEATKAIRNSQKLGDKADIPIIAMTAYAMAGDRETFLSAGMNGYISKPVDLDGLLTTINETLSART